MQSSIGNVAIVGIRKKNQRNKGTNMQITETGYYETRDGGLAYASPPPIHVKNCTTIVGWIILEDGEERVELSKLWVGWYEYDGALNRTNAYRQKRDLMRHFNTLSVKLLAITPADATSFVIGEGLE